jgi:hypothetical protein
MVLVRMVFQVRQGHIRDLVEAMKQLTQAEPNRPHILTDLRARSTRGQWQQFNRHTHLFG